MSSDPEDRKLIVEALYKSEDLAESGKAMDREIMDEVKHRTGFTEAQIEDGLHDYLKQVDTERMKIDQGLDLNKAFRIAATGTGILLSIQKTIRSHRIAKNGGLPVNDIATHLTQLNDIRIRLMGGTDNDPISMLVRRVLEQ